MTDALPMTPRPDFSFVPRIGRDGFSPAELARLRGDAARESHYDAILKESLLDRDHDPERLRAALATLGDDYVFNSFPTELFAGANLVVRSEYLLMRHVGSGAIAFDDVHRLAAESGDRLTAAAPRSVMYRLCDYNPTDFGFLDGSSRTRGAQRLLEEPELLHLDLLTIGELLSAGVPVDLLVPYVQLPAQLARLLAAIRSHFDGAAARPRRMGMMLEVPANLYEVERFEGVDFYAFGPADMLQCFYGGLDRNAGDFDAADETILVEPVRRVLASIDGLGGRSAYLSKSLLGLAADLDLAAWTNTTIGRLFFPGQLRATD